MHAPLTSGSDVYGVVASASICICQFRCRSIIYTKAIVCASDGAGLLCGRVLVDVSPVIHRGPPVRQR